MSPSGVIVERHDPVTVLRLDRPPANALGLELARELEAALDSAAVTDARALVLVGSGRFFSGGLDLKAVPRYSREQQRELLNLLNRLLGRLYGLPIPVVGAINGHAVAGAFILALASDYRIGARGDARLGLTEARVGIPFPAVPMIILHAEWAPQDVRYSTLWAKTFGPEEALRRGALDELVPPPEVLGRAIEVARDMGSMPADSYARVKQQVRATALAKIQEVVSRGSDPMLENWLSPEAQAAAAAQLGATRQP